MDDVQPFQHISEPKKRAFLTAFALTGHTTRSCEAADISPGLIYTNGWTRDETFQEAYEDARIMAGDALTNAARERAIEGMRSYKFSKEGVPLRHPEECDCGHPRTAHPSLAQDGEEGKSIVTPCVMDECGCRVFIGRPYFETKVSDTVLIFLLKGTFPERHAERREVRGLLAKLDLNMLPNTLIQRIAAGEAIESVLAAGASEAGITPGELVRGALKPGDPPGSG